MKAFGRLKDGREAHLYTLKNRNFIVTMTDYGATVVSWIDRKSGIDILQGYDSVEGYVEQTPYMGATVGRVANRIGKGKFFLNGREYTLEANDRGNSLHSGSAGFSQKLFDVQQKDETLVFTLHSPDGEGGFPGNLDVSASYTLLQDGLDFLWQGTSDQDTLLAMTNHMFFNLRGPTSDTAMDLELKVNADEYAPIDQNGLTLDVRRGVAGSPFDFRDYHPLGERVDARDAQIRFGKGYDHCFLLRGRGYREAASLRSDKLVLTVFTDLEGMQLYSGNFLRGDSRGKEGGTFPKRSAVCLETQYVPNAINGKSFEKPVLKKGETVSRRTFYRLEGRK